MSEHKINRETIDNLVSAEALSQLRELDELLAGILSKYQQLLSILPRLSSIDKSL